MVLVHIDDVGSISKLGRGEIWVHFTSQQLIQMYLVNETMVLLQSRLAGATIALKFLLAS